MIDVVVDEAEYIWRLTLILAGPDYRDEATLESADRDELVNPEIVEDKGLIYERYPGDIDGEFDEFRFDYIVSRSLKHFRKTPAPQPAFGADEEEPPPIRPERQT